MTSPAKCESTKVRSADLRGFSYAAYILPPPPKVAWKLERQPASVPDPTAHCSSSRPSRQIGRLEIISMTCWLSS